MRFALLLTILFSGFILPLPFWWFWIHSKIDFAKKIGVINYFIIGIMIVITSAVLFYLRENIFKYIIMKNTYFEITGVLIIVLSIIIDGIRSKEFTLKQLLGLPEIMPKQKQKLITSGIFSNLRHPRYLEYMLLSLGLALISGYLFSYLIFVYTIIMFYFLSIFEEKELVRRFGKKYQIYARKVPRFIPKLKLWS
ncbi:isoprenylcysteine carboxylmethyltransferase family protein [Candidatus Woesearchaeota archaeon]|nr:isoprenylcysteine carboxylmethyltransferase family protein [Candidatus Woesearchaeota archaeon]